MKFKQRNWFEVNEYWLLDSGIQQMYKSLSKSYEQTINYEEIGNEIVKQSTRRKGWLIAAIIFSAISATCVVSSFLLKENLNEGIIFWLVIAGICYVIYLATLTNRIFLIGKVNLFFYNKKKEKDEIHNFLIEIEQKRKGYYKDKYYKIDEDIDTDAQIQRLKWLKENEIITNVEYEHMKDILKSENNKVEYIYN